jgi:hypothetical protein
MFIKNTGLFILIGSLLCSSAYSGPNNNLQIRPDSQPSLTKPSIPSHPGLERLHDTTDIHSPVSLEHAKQLGYSIENLKDGNTLLKSPDSRSEILLGSDHQIKSIKTTLANHLIDITPSPLLGVYDVRVKDTNGTITTAKMADQKGDVIVTSEGLSHLPYIAKVDREQKNISFSDGTKSVTYSYQNMEPDSSFGQLLGENLNLLPITLAAALIEDAATYLNNQ